MTADEVRRSLDREQWRAWARDRAQCMTPTELGLRSAFELLAKSPAVSFVNTPDAKRFEVGERWVFPPEDTSAPSGPPLTVTEVDHAHGRVSFKVGE